MPIRIEENIPEGSSQVAEVPVYDEEGDPAVPTAAWYSLYDASGNVINEREDVVITDLAATLYVLLTPADTAMSTAQAKEARILALKWTAPSTLMPGEDLTGREEARFSVERMMGVGST
ncbi:MAG: hypothetical protein ABIJ95_08115 [Pseudomonadota bacterium]